MSDVSVSNTKLLRLPKPCDQGFFFLVLLRGVRERGGGHNRKLDSTLQCAQWKITDAHIDAHIYCIYLFNSISYGIHREGKEIQKNE